MPSRAYAHALKQLRTICLSLPEATEVEAWGHPTYEAYRQVALKRMLKALAGKA